MADETLIIGLEATGTGKFKSELDGISSSMSKLGDEGSSSMNEVRSSAADLNQELAGTATEVKGLGGVMKSNLAKAGAMGAAISGVKALADTVIATTGALIEFARGGAEASSVAAAFSQSFSAEDMEAFQRATAGTVDGTTLQQMAMLAKNAGISAQEFQNLGKLAAKTSEELGGMKTTAEILNATIKGEAGQLKEVGLFVDMTQEKFAGLSEQARAAAVAMELSAQGADIAADSIQGAATSFAQTETDVTNLLSDIQQFTAELLVSSGAMDVIKGALGAVRKIFDDNKESIQKLVEFGLTMLSASMRVLSPIIGAVSSGLDSMLTFLQPVLDLIGFLAEAVAVVIENLLMMRDAIEEVGEWLGFVEPKTRALSHITRDYAKIIEEEINPAIEQQVAEMEALAAQTEVTTQKTLTLQRIMKEGWGDVNEEVEDQATLQSKQERHLRNNNEELERFQVLLHENGWRADLLAQEMAHMAEDAGAVNSEFEAIQALEETALRTGESINIMLEKRAQIQSLTNEQVLDQLNKQIGGFTKRSISEQEALEIRARWEADINEEIFARELVLEQILDTQLALGARTVEQVETTKSVTKSTNKAAEATRNWAMELRIFIGLTKMAFEEQKQLHGAAAAFATSAAMGAGGADLTVDMEGFDALIERLRILAQERGEAFRLQEFHDFASGLREVNQETMTFFDSVSDQMSESSRRSTEWISAFVGAVPALSDSISEMSVLFTEEADAMGAVEKARIGVTSAIGPMRAFTGAFVKDKRAQAGISAAMETAASIASFAALDFRGGALHALAAIKYGIIAGGMGGGGGAGGAGAASSAASAGGGATRAAAGTAATSARPSRRPEGGETHFHFHTLDSRTAFDMMVDTLNDGARSNGGRVIDGRLTPGDVQLRGGL